MALRLIAEIMQWPEDDGGTATAEYSWLRLMSAVKYDGYSDFRAGVRFLESLATWLKQFDQRDRQAAYDFVKKRLVYISPPEFQCLVESFIPDVVTRNIRTDIADELEIAPYEIWRTNEGAQKFNRRLRKTLFVGMSDGSRVDMLRRANAGRISTEQVVPINVDYDKWEDLGKNLSQESGMVAGEKFDSVYLIDDFTASGTTFIRQVHGEWKGKLKRFNDQIVAAKKDLGETFPIASNYALHVHHYISSHKARNALLCRLQNAADQWPERTFDSWAVTEGLLLPQWLELSTPQDQAILEICDRYYDHMLFERLKKHCEQAGQTTMKLGYDNCALPIVLDHNTPNNSIPLLWAETSGKNDSHPMRPLFHRRDRHG